VKDGGIRGIVMILTDMNAISVDGHYIYAESGAGIIEVSREAYRHSLTGLEFACGIPGSVGGAVFMNAGAYEGEITDINVKIEAINREGQFLTYTNEDAEFAYRHSIFQENDNIILGVSFELQPGDQEAIKEKMDHLTELRESKQPLEYPSCGSVFKRPVGYYTGKLIQDAGLQGHRIGGAEISRKHAGFIINVGGATATDYVEMIEYIQETIWNLNSVRLETEVRIIGREAE
ncbi:MAG: UDP-N-acetylmuramate dehydrogenase, partial [Ruoffia tabacinasalis]